MSQEVVTGYGKFSQTYFSVGEGSDLICLYSILILGKRIQEYICIIIGSCLLAFNTYNVLLNFRLENWKWHVASVCKYSLEN